MDFKLQLKLVSIIRKKSVKSKLKSIVQDFMDSIPPKMLKKLEPVELKKIEKDAIWITRKILNEMNDILSQYTY